MSRLILKTEKIKKNWVSLFTHHMVIGIILPSLMILIISCSHHPQSRSRLLAQAAEKEVQRLKHTTHFLDLQTTPLPLCDGHSSHEDIRVVQAKALVASAEGVLLALPIYNYGANAITKNFIENTGEAWKEKPVGMLCAAGGKGSYMALVPLAGSLMLDFHCYIVPRHVYGTGDQFEHDRIIDLELQKRINLMVDEICWLSSAIAKRKPTRN